MDGNLYLLTDKLNVSPRLRPFATDSCLYPLATLATPPMPSKQTLSSVDYALFFGSLLLTLLVGMHQAWRGRRDSAEEMVAASKGMPLPVVVLSMAATYIAAIVLLGEIL